MRYVKSCFSKPILFKVILWINIGLILASCSVHRAMVKVEDSAYSSYTLYMLEQLKASNPNTAFSVIDIYQDNSKSTDMNELMRKLSLKNYEFTSIQAIIYNDEKGANEIIVIEGVERDAVFSDME